MPEWTGPKPKILVQMTPTGNYSWEILWHNKPVRVGCTGNHASALSQAKRNREFVMQNILKGK